MRIASRDKIKWISIGVLLLLCGTQGVMATDVPSPTLETEKKEAPLAARPESFPKKDSTEAAVIRGETAFKRYCVLCHGINADGNGRAAKKYDPKPANLRTSEKNTLYKVMIITKGGAAVSRSPFMPPWGEELTTEQITDVVSYLNSIADHPPKD
jgi:mono/diheme cytochrome c family protein